MRYNPPDYEYEKDEKGNIIYEWCDQCDGSGEGMWDGSQCGECRGTGELPMRKQDDHDEF